MKLAIILSLLTIQALSVEPNPPVWPSSVKVIEVGDKNA